MSFSTMYGYYQSASSSSSSSPSGVTTPLDEVAPRLVHLAKEPSVSKGFRSSGSSSLSLDKQGFRLSLSKRFLPSTTRKPKLSLDTSAKARPIPALPSASAEHSPLGAFSPTSSATTHLLSVATHAKLDTVPLKPSVSARPHHARSNSTSHDGKGPSPSLRRLRASSFRSLTFSWSSAQMQHSPYDVDADTGDEHETFWPRDQPRKQAHRNVPSISRSPSPSVYNVGDPTPSPALISRNSSPLIPTQSNPSKRRAPPSMPISSTSPLSSSHFRNATTASSGAAAAPPKRPTATHVRSSSASLLPPRPGPSRGGYGAGSPAIYPSSKPTGASSGGLNSALAAVERASRLHSQCECGVCGKVGSDYPRCPRCSATWCSRQCRMSEAGGAKHTCRAERRV